MAEAGSMAVEVATVAEVGTDEHEANDDPDTSAEGASHATHGWPARGILDRR
ncbi:MAG: hypothetical protein JWO52_8098 [Gammaproteobacteria bacterium]|jgi:hypothetical protein|nr:hypothetical protein [Gammaproteobacteria bacterium]